MPQCSAFQCKNKGVYCFPTDKKLRDQWIKALHLKNCKPYSSATTARICADHFIPDDYFDTEDVDSTFKHRVLKRTAVPSLCLFMKQDVKKSKSQSQYETVTSLESSALESNLQITETEERNVIGTKQYGQCRCCLKKDFHDVVNIVNMLTCLNVEICIDPSMPRLLCSDCGKFLQQVRSFQATVATSQKTLSKQYNIENVSVKEAGQLDLPETGFGPMVSSEHNQSENATLEEDIEKEDTKEEKDFAVRELKNKSKLNTQIRENLSMILTNSTVIPFTTSRSENFECVYCDKSCTHFSDIRVHVETKHSNEDYEFVLKALYLIPELILRADVSCVKCRMCDEKFTTIDNLVNHLVDVHKKKYHNITRDPPHNVLCFNMTSDCLKCIDCDKSFTHFRGLLMHMNQHYGSYLCPDCGSKFLYEHSYKLHLVQEKQRDSPGLQCQLCGAKYSRKMYLKRHMKKNHPDG